MTNVLLLCIYVKSDFDVGLVTDSSDMFTYSGNLIGGNNTDYQKIFSYIHKKNDY